MIRRRLVENPRRRRPAPTADHKAAAELRQTFVDREPENIESMNWDWPRSLVHCGSCLAVMYRSDKWQKRRGQMVAYKHLAEGPQQLYVRRGFIQGYPGHENLKAMGPSAPIAGMPTAFAVLADCIGVQAQLFQRDKKGFYLPNGSDNICQIDLDGLKLGGGHHPETNDAFLVIYDSDNCYCLITGSELDIEKDGIVG